MLKKLKLAEKDAFGFMDAETIIKVLLNRSSKDEMPNFLKLQITAYCVK